jgi:hypothetical protein
MRRSWLRAGPADPSRRIEGGNCEAVHTGILQSPLKIKADRVEGISWHHL